MTMTPALQTASRLTNARSAFFTRGTTHALCQDTARVGVDREGQSYAIVCDGCSSSPETDFGSRILARAAEIEILRGHQREPSLAVIVERAIHMASALELPERCLDATLLTARTTDEGVRYRIAGDGVFAARADDGRIGWTSVQFPHNAPFYPSYLLSPRRMERWLELTEGLASWERRSERGRRETHTFSTAINPEFMGTVAWKRHDLVALFSDGVLSFREEKRTATSVEQLPVPLQPVLSQLLSVRNTRGPFMLRRCRRFLERSCAKLGWHATDDFSVAAIARDKRGEGL